jgi:hypothetical protein
MKQLMKLGNKALRIGKAMQKTQKNAVKKVVKKKAC